MPPSGWRSCTVLDFRAMVVPVDSGALPLMAGTTMSAGDPKGKVRGMFSDMDLSSRRVF